MKKFGFMALLALVVWNGDDCRAAALYSSGHADLGIGFDGGEFDIHVHAEGATIGGVFYADEEFEAGDVTILVPVTTQETRLANVAPILNFDPIGVAAGESYFKLPQTNAEATGEGAPFLGIATEEIDDGIFVGNQITLTIVDVVGPGFFSIFQDAVPGPNFKASSADGLPDSFVFATGIHDHFNYGFTAPGIYEVTIRATGELTLGGMVQGEGVYTFAVAVPETGTVVLCGLASFGFMGAVIRRRNCREKV